MGTVRGPLDTSHLQERLIRLTVQQTLGHADTPERLLDVAAAKCLAPLLYAARVLMPKHRPLTAARLPPLHSAAACPVLDCFLHRVLETALRLSH